MSIFKYMNPANWFGGGGGDQPQGGGLIAANRSQRRDDSDSDPNVALQALVGFGQGYSNPGGLAGAAGGSIAKILMNYRRKQMGNKPPNVGPPTQPYTGPGMYDDPMAQPGGGFQDPSLAMGQQPQAPAAFADGGVVHEPTLAMLGEDGPEMVIPLTDRPGNKVHPSMAMNYCSRR